MLGFWGFAFFLLGSLSFVIQSKGWRIWGENLQGNKVQTFKTLIFVLTEVGLNVHSRQASPGRVIQTEATAAPEMFLRQKKQDQHFPYQVWLESSQMGQTQGFDSAFPPETSEWASMLTSLSTCYWHWCPLWGELYEGVIPKEGSLSTIHSCTSPLSHSNSLGTMLFKSLFYCSWLVMFLCSLGWQSKLSSICTSA